MEYIIKIVPIFIALLVLIQLYFRIADRFNIIDKPNERSSHSSITLRGGGIIFPLSIIIFSLTHNFQYAYVAIGVLIAATVSFWDDIKTIGSGVRLMAQLSAVLLLFHELELFGLAIWVIPVLIIFAIANINAFNFMDALNGLSVLHYLSIVGTALYIQLNVIEFIELDFLVYVLCGFVVFAIYNVRPKAKCFAGDIGSISAALICMFVVYKLVYVTEDIKYIFLMLVFGVDSFITIGIRAFKKEHIMEPHRKHLCQYLANETKKSHLFVAVSYFIVQMIFNVFLLQLDTIMSFVLVGLVILAYLLVRYMIYKKHVVPTLQK